MELAQPQKKNIFEWVLDIDQQQHIFEVRKTIQQQIQQQNEDLKYLVTRIQSLKKTQELLSEPKQQFTKTIEKLQFVHTLLKKNQDNQQKDQKDQFEKQIKDKIAQLQENIKELDSLIKTEEQRILQYVAMSNDIRKNIINFEKRLSSLEERLLMNKYWKSFSSGLDNRQYIELFFAMTQGLVKNGQWLDLLINDKKTEQQKIADEQLKKQQHQQFYKNFEPPQRGNESDLYLFQNQTLLLLAQYSQLLKLQLILKGSIQIRIILKNFFEENNLYEQFPADADIDLGCYYENWDQTIPDKVGKILYILIKISQDDMIKYFVQNKNTHCKCNKQQFEETGRLPQTFSPAEYYPQEQDQYKEQYFYKLQGSKEIKAKFNKYRIRKIINQDEQYFQYLNDMVITLDQNQYTIKQLFGEDYQLDIHSSISTPTGDFTLFRLKVCIGDQYYNGEYLDISLQQKKNNDYSQNIQIAGLLYSQQPQDWLLDTYSQIGRQNPEVSKVKRILIRYCLALKMLQENDYLQKLKIVKTDDEFYRILDETHRKYNVVQSEFDQTIDYLKKIKTNFQDIIEFINQKATEVILLVRNKKEIKNRQFI